MVTAHLRSVGGGRTHPLGKPVAKLPARARACGPSRSPWSRKARAGADCSARRYTPRAIVVPEVGERRKVSSPSRVTMAGEETPRNGWPPYHPAWQPGQAGMPPEAARTEGPPRTRPRRWINRAKRTARRSRTTPRGCHALAGAFDPAPRVGATQTTRRSQGIATEQAGPCTQRADLHICAPGRTRTCTLRIRSRPTTVHAVVRGGVVAAQVRWVVRLMRLCCAVWCLAE